MTAKRTIWALAVSSLVATAAHGQDLRNGGAALADPPEVAALAYLWAWHGQAADTATPADASVTVGPEFNGWPYLLGTQELALDQAGALTATAAEASTTAAGVAALTVTNGPVPDTPAVRRMYPPLSRAGRATAAAGN